MVTNTSGIVELVETGERRDRRGRRITPAGRRDELVTAWRQSGLTQAEFARREGVRYPTFAIWVQQARQAAEGRQPAPPMRFAEVQAAAKTAASALEVHFAGWHGGARRKRPGSDRQVLRSSAALSPGKDAGAATALLEPLVKRMKQDLLQSGYVQVDETPIRCNDPDLRDGKTTQGWLWALSRPGGDVVFEWRLSRRHEEAERLLGNYRGVLQSDGYEAYAAYARTHPGVEWAGCWAHARRRFFEAAAERPRTAERVLRLIAQLYALERTWDEAEVGDRRAARRQAHFAQPLARLRRLVTALRARVLPKSGLGQACAYLRGHWSPLAVHLRHSHTQLDTNAVENAIRPSKLGAKNWLFVGHPSAGDRPAMIYSLVVSCQRHGIDPHAYLKDVLARLPAMTTTDDLRPLLPSQWQPPTLPAS